MATKKNEIYKCKVCMAEVKVEQGGSGALMCCMTKMDKIG
ncbi:desulfoferrodoxin [Limisalsivibrio acetivorans]|nr:desulfoferrodoxin [Limisalsivibrio acetivorans]